MGSSLCDHWHRGLVLLCLCRRTLHKECWVWRSQGWFFVPYMHHTVNNDVLFWYILLLRIDNKNFGEENLGRNTWQALFKGLLWPSIHLSLHRLSSWLATTLSSPSSWPATGGLCGQGQVSLLHLIRKMIFSILFPSLGDIPKRFRLTPDELDSVEGSDDVEVISCSCWCNFSKNTAFTFRFKSGY